MIYIMSDIHGRLDLFEKMMEQIGYSDSDTLYVLGDIVYRGGSLAVMKRLESMNGVIPICGNHELSLIVSAPKIIRKPAVLSDYECILKYPHNPKSRGLFQGIKGMLDGQCITHLHEALSSLLYSPELTTSADVALLTDEEYQQLISFLRSFKVYDEVTVNDHRYLLTHGFTLPGIESGEFFTKPVDFEALDHPDCDTVIFGHKTTRDIRIRTEHSLKIPYTIWHDDDKIGIDCGAPYPHGQLACLRLDDMKEFYVPNERDMLVSLAEINDKYRKLGEWAESGI